MITVSFYIHRKVLDATVLGQDGDHQVVEEECLRAVKREFGDWQKHSEPWSEIAARFELRRVAEHRHKVSDLGNRRVDI